MVQQPVVQHQQVDTTCGSLLRELQVFCRPLDTLLCSSISITSLSDVCGPICSFLIGRRKHAVVLSLNIREEKEQTYSGTQSKDHWVSLAAHMGRGGRERFREGQDAVAVGAGVSGGLQAQG